MQPPKNVYKTFNELLGFIKDAKMPFGSKLTLVLFKVTFVQTTIVQMVFFSNKNLGPPAKEFI